MTSKLSFQRRGDKGWSEFALIVIDIQEAFWSEELEKFFPTVSSPSFAWPLRHRQQHDSDNNNGNTKDR
jgi:hypothetical protein